MKLNMTFHPEEYFVLKQQYHLIWNFYLRCKIILKIQLYAPISLIREQDFEILDDNIYI